MLPYETPAEIAALIREVLPAGLAALAGALAGAWAAFQFESRAEERRRETEEVALGQQALFSLIQQLKWLALVEDTLELRSWARIDEKWYGIPSLERVTRPPKLQIERLNFLLERRTANLMSNLMSCQWSFDSYAHLVESRSEYQLEVAQPWVGRYVQLKTLRPEPTAIELARVVEPSMDPAVVGRLRNDTTRMCDEIGTTIRTVWRAYERLREALLCRFPGTELFAVLKVPEPLKVYLKDEQTGTPTARAKER